MQSLCCLVLSTVPDVALGKKIARHIIKSQLAACVHIMPLGESLYIWEGQIQEEQEAQLLIKTRPEALDDLKACFAEYHPYELPEFVVLDIQDSSSESYVAWIKEMVPGFD